MAKEKLNLSAAIRDAISKNKKGSAREIMEAIQSAHPTAKIKFATASVTWSKIRRNMGLIKGGKSKRVSKPKRGAVPSTNGIVGVLDAAQALVRQAGGLDQARALLNKLGEL